MMMLPDRPASGSRPNKKKQCATSGHPRSFTAWHSRRQSPHFRYAIYIDKNVYVPLPSSHTNSG